ncbi:MAG: hypothetical protein JWR04_2779 [Rhodoglobus sp.]|nr:hypothetical protein [Rhodoglobus sp.]
MELRDADVVVYRRGLVVALFAVDVVAALWLAIQSFFLGLGNWGRYTDLDSVRDLPLYWVNVLALALITLATVWNVRAEYRDGHRFVAGAVLAGLSFVPLLFGLWQLAATP